MKQYLLPRGATSADQLRIVEVPQPRPGRGEVLVQVKACSLNFRDQMIASGKYVGSVAEDTVPLSDGVGEVIEVGAEATLFRPGDRVAGLFFQEWLDGPVPADRGRSLGESGSPGMLAEFVVLPETGVVRLASSLEYAEAAMLPCAGVTAWNALLEGPRPVGPGRTVLVLGTGGVSLLALQLAAAAGARVFVTSASDAKLERARALGAAGGLNYTKVPEWGAHAAAWTGCGGFDHVVEVGGAGTLAQSMAALACGGEIALIGLLSSKALEGGLLALAMKGGSIRGIGVGSRAMAQRLHRAVDANAIRPVVDRVFPFAEAREAYRYQASAALFGKVVISIG